MIKADYKLHMVEMNGTLPELCADAEMILTSLKTFMNKKLPGVGDELIKQIYTAAKNGDMKPKMQIDLSALANKKREGNGNE